MGATSVGRAEESKGVVLCLTAEINLNIDSAQLQPAVQLTGLELPMRKEAAQICSEAMARQLYLPASVLDLRASVFTAQCCSSRAFYSIVVSAFRLVLHAVRCPIGWLLDSLLVLGLRCESLIFAMRWKICLEEDVDEI